MVQQTTIDGPPTAPQTTGSIRARAQLWLSAYTPWIIVVFIPLINGGLSLINKSALIHGMDFHVFSVYRNVLAVLVLAAPVVYYERLKWEQATWKTGLHVLGLAILEPVMDQNFAYAGLKKIPVSLSSSFGLMQPVITFVLACLFRYERVSFAERASKLKVAGTCVAVLGAVVVVISPGNKIVPLPWTSSHSHAVGNQHVNTIEGIVFCVIAMLSQSSYNILLTRTLADFPAPWTITAGTCLIGAPVNWAVATVLGSGIGPRWIVTVDVTLLSYLYSGVMVSALAAFLVSIVMRARGPVFVAAFSPVSMVFVTVVGTLVLGEQLYLARLLAVCLIIFGMSLLLWGSAEENKAKLAATQAPRQPADQPTQPSPPPEEV